MSCVLRYYGWSRRDTRHTEKREIKQIERMNREKDREGHNYLSWIEVRANCFNKWLIKQLIFLKYREIRILVKVTTTMGFKNCFLNEWQEKILKKDFTFPALKMPNRPARFLSFKADMVPLLVSDFNPLLDERLTVEWVPVPKPLPVPLLDESEPTLPLLIVLRSSNGKSSGGRNPDLYFSITTRESYIDWLV